MQRLGNVPRKSLQNSVPPTETPTQTNLWKIIRQVPGCGHHHFAQKVYICLVVQTTSEVHVVRDCPAGQVYVFRQLSSLVHLQQVESRLASYLKAGFASDLPVLLYRMNQNHFSSFCVILNDPDSNSPIIDSIEFNKLNRLLAEVNPLGVYGCLHQAKRSSISYEYIKRGPIINGYMLDMFFLKISDHSSLKLREFI
jgi:hypothetical protein